MNRVLSITILILLGFGMNYANAACGRYTKGNPVRCVSCPTDRWAWAYDNISGFCTACTGICISFQATDQFDPVRVEFQAKNAVTDKDAGIQYIKVEDGVKPIQFLKGLQASTLLVIAQKNSAAAALLAILQNPKRRGELTLANGHAYIPSMPRTAYIEAVLAGELDDDDSGAIGEALLEEISTQRHIYATWSVVSPKSSDGKYVVRFDTWWQSSEAQAVLLGKAAPSILVYISEDAPRPFIGWEIPSN